jgi:oligo-alginate lyase
VAVIPYAPGGEGQRPLVHPIAGGENSLEVQIENGVTATDVFLNLQADGRRMHLNTNNRIAGWDTDAYLIAWTRPAARMDDPGAVSRFFVSCGSYVRREDRVYLDSLSKVDAVWKPGKSGTAEGAGSDRSNSAIPVPWRVAHASACAT